MKIGLVSATFRNKTPKEVIALAIENKLDCIEWSGDIHVPPTNIENAEEVGRMTRFAGISTPSYGSYYRVGSGEGDFDSEIATALALGASNIRVWAGKKGSENISESEKNLVYADAKRIVKAAKNRGVTVSLEYHQNTLTDTAESTAELLKNVDDLYSYWQYQPTRDEFCNLSDIRALGVRLSNIHIQNISDPHWEKLVPHLRSLGENRYFFIEFVRDNCVEQFASDVKTLRKLLASV